jgi:glutaredoxin
MEQLAAPNGYSLSEVRSFGYWAHPTKRRGEIIMNTNKRKVEVFSAGCPACAETVKLVQQIACSSCDVEVLDMNKPEVATKARQYGVKTVPAVAINGKLAGCCTGAGPNEVALRSTGLGVAV